ncbi:chorismate--pyruvate lyase family protein [Permianibacter aggregans]|uniref:Probable chorismate pyruvate-lyase n=1 Tax=Permianibacter aggregans TaxID=1510150 RepID=A0A4R6ULI5_9GAMM|nr:chorismate lyase [Permianibacter aggregans]QGX40245.1 chorismate lyase [Permianibacter aggregans]TDQ47502.1 chorismate lyase [Permianibacter aggregans]
MLNPWQNDAPALRPVLQRLLLEPGSFTAALRSRLGDIAVRPLSEGWSTARGEEALALQMMGVRQAFVREVLLVGEQQQWVFARSVIPAASLRGPNRELTKLGTQALGSLLFAGEGQRTNLEFCRLTARQPLAARLRAHGIVFSQGLPARRSVFLYRRMPLLVQEVLLPDLIYWGNHVAPMANPLG